MKLFAVLLSGIMAAAPAMDTRQEITTVINAVNYTILVNADGKTAELKSALLPASYAETFVPQEIEGYTITSLSEKAYAGNFSLEKITIHGGIKSMGAKTFMSCTELKEVVIGQGITAIPDECFFSCPKLTKVTLPTTLKSIGEEAFFGCEELDAVIPSGVIAIGKDAIGKKATAHEEGSVLVEGFLMKGTTGSTAARYARENGIDFVDPKNFVAGDVNGDDTSDASDASSVLAEYAMVSTGAPVSYSRKQIFMGDMNSDGIIDASDSSVILEIYAANSTGGGKG